VTALHHAAAELLIVVSVVALIVGIIRTATSREDQHR